MLLQYSYNPNTLSQLKLQKREQKKPIFEPEKSDQIWRFCIKRIDPLTEKLTKLSVATGIDVPVVECVPNLSREGQLPSHFRSDRRHLEYCRYIP